MWQHFCAAVLGPIACWSPIIIFLTIPVFTSGDLMKGMPAIVDDLSSKLAIAFLLVYFPLSAAICGFSASYFLRNEFATLPKGERINIGCWTRFLFMVPFCLHPAFLCCLAIFVIPIHLWIFDLALYKGGEFWISERPKQLLGEYETPPNSED